MEMQTRAYTSFRRAPCFAAKWTGWQTFPCEYRGRLCAWAFSTVNPFNEHGFATWTTSRFLFFCNPKRSTASFTAPNATLGRRNIPDNQFGLFKTSFFLEHRHYSVNCRCDTHTHCRKSFHIDLRMAHRPRGRLTSRTLRSHLAASAESSISLAVIFDSQ